MKFSPALISASILAPLRYFFKTYGGKFNLTWSEDEKLRQIEIADAHDFNKIAIGERPRILVSRGSYQINGVGIADNLAEAPDFVQTKGNIKRINMALYEGTAQMIIEARNKGTCEVITDMATHFLAWSRPDICDTQGFKTFALPMSVSDCAPTQPEGDVKFQVTVGIPYMKEEQWQINRDGIALKGILASLDVGNPIPKEWPGTTPGYQNPIPPSVGGLPGQERDCCVDCQNLY